MIALCPLARADVARVQGLTLAPGQDGFVGTIADMTDAPDPLQDFHVIEQGAAPVGFFKIDRAYERRHPELGAGAHALRGLLIDAAHQGRGLGRAAMGLLPGYIRAHYPAARHLWLTVDADNAAAIALYTASGWQREPGFAYVGRVGPEVRFCLPLTSAGCPWTRAG